MSPGAPPDDRRRGPLFHAEKLGERDEVREFTPTPPRYKAPVDAQERAIKLRALMYSPAGVIMGLGLGVIGSSKYGWPGWMALVTAVLGWALVYYGPQIITNMGGKAAGSIYNPSGRSTPREKEYSYEESLVARGQYEEAVTAFEIAAHENPGDPTPYLRIARILRDRLERYEDSARWFKKALAETGISGGRAFLARKELVEVYWHKMGEPQKAAPDLARMAAELQGTPEGEWAAQELRRVKEIIAQQQDFG